MFNVKSVAPAGLTLDLLKPYQLGILDEETQKTVASPSHCKNKKWRFVWKSPSPGNGGSFPDKNNVKAAIKSLPIDVIDDIKLFDGATAERKTFEAYLGFDGISACDSLKFECGQTYQIVLHASGKPVRDVLGRDYTEIVPFMTGCCDDCTGEEAVVTTLRTITDAIETNSHYIKQFFDVHEVRNCCPAETPFTEVPFTDYCVTVCDGGGYDALGEIAGYPAFSALNIYRDSYENGKSTYKAECLAAQPAAFVQTATVLQDCATCPSGFTAVLARKKYLISIDNAAVGVNAAAWLAEVQAVAAYSTAVAATLLYRQEGNSYYEVLFPVAFVTPAVVADSTITFVAEVPASCVLTTPVSTAWTACGTKYKISRTMCITVKNGDCDNAAGDLAAITAYMATVPNIVLASLTQETAGDCISRYTIGQYSACLEDGCDWKGSDKAKFDDLPGYLGASWAPCNCEGWTFDDGCPVAPEPVDPADCRGGLKFVGKNFENPIVACADDFWEARETEFAQLEVSITEYGTSGCKAMQVPWKVVQRGSGPEGTGKELLRREIQARGYSQYDYHGANSPDGNLISARRGEVYSFDADKLYNTIDVYHMYHRNRYAQNTGSDTREVITLAVEANKLTLLAQLKTLLNEATLASGNCSFL